MAGHGLAEARMLKRLELIGFKSFAELTRFDFAPGITAVVGPNGSGKSNIVDAVKWILGEQSAKSLRGGEMADVIFNGSSTRKSLGMAEVTMTFDNSRRPLNFDGDEVQITRRVYRDGQGEYLINGQMSRLKDIKEVFLGSGAGHGAYSIIEQGRVDALLTASTKDRRFIFEEAAGISRFKAKKIEALRKLERVNADLNRVRDLMQELEKNLRTLTAQAAKAQKYQEYQTRLRELRVQVALYEYRESSAKLETEAALLAELHAEVSTATGQIEHYENEARKLAWELTRTEDSLRVQEKRLGEARQQIAGQEASVRSGREQLLALDAELLRIGKQRAEMGQRIRVLEAEASQVAAEVEGVAERTQTEQQHADATAEALHAVVTQIADLTRQTQADREQQFESVSRAAQLHSTAQMNREQMERLGRELTRKQAEAARCKAEAEGLQRGLADLSRDDADLQQRLTTAKQSCHDYQHRQAELRRKADQLQPELDRDREQCSALRGRAEVLEGLERSLEGLGSGVRQVLEYYNASPDHRSVILGLVADLVTAPRAIAPLMDVVLGDAAQRFIVADVQALDGVLRDLGDLDGRVGFVPLNAQRAIPPGPTPPHTLAAFAQAELPGLVDLLLGNVLLADDLPMARALASAYPGYRIVTRAGELLEPDGTLTVGPPQADMGMLSRKSELRDLREQIAVLEGQIERLAADQADDRQQAEALEGPIAALQAEIDTLEGVADTLRDRMVVQREKQARLQDQMELLTSESAILTDEVHKAEQAWHQARQQAEAEDATARTLKARLAEADQAMKTAAAARETRQQEHTEAQVALGRVQQQLAALKARAASLDSEVRQRKVEAVGLAAQERASRVRQTELTLTILRATAQAADAYRDKEDREQRVLELNTRREHLRTTLDQVQTDLSSIRDSSSARREQAHRHELTVKELQGRRDAVADRMREDYEIDLAAYLTSSPEGSESPDMASSPPARETHAEIEDLRRKIAKLGSVNLEALEQLTAEETREREIRTQHDDLVHAETSLLEIIEQINADSRKLFMETLTSVRVHFQELFRKLFGGGMADIILENEADVLESGIEITARPPGKELRSISLLSGGEKTLTAVALLLAIFRSKPSPFCLLDEVDAALDEANAVRLAGVIQEFREQSQFIIITHKKRTMAAADVLHGVTMQESGVSKRIAIRFEDWPDDPPEMAERQGAA